VVDRIASEGDAGGPARILFLNGRDCGNPEGGGSEIYVETVARALAAGGNEVTIHAAAFPGSRSEEWTDGVRLVRGGSKLGVYPHALRQLRRGALGRPDVVVDVQNGIPFASTLVASAPTVTLVHHVHREQWPVVFGPVLSRIGWWIESRVGPRVYRRCRYVAVSEATRDELVALGVDQERISIVHNGVQVRHVTGVHRSPVPRVLVLGRLVPHKQVEHVLRAAAVLRDTVPGLRVSVVGDGWWSAELTAEADRLGVTDLVEFLGFVDDATKQRELERAWVLALPSLKEGWGLAITEAAAHHVPAVAYRAAGGVAESIRDGASGLLVDGGPAEFTEALRRLLTDDALRARLSEGAAARARDLSWQRTADAFAAVLGEVVGRPIAAGCVPREAQLHSGSPSTAGARSHD
jgi:glycosyltransferase involved in cell wall biosynthesis